MSELTRYPLCWPDNVYRTAPQDRGYPKFNERTVAEATGLLLAEINRLNEHNYDYQDERVIVSTNIPLRQRDGLPFSDRTQPVDTGAAVYFQLRFRRGSHWKYDRKHKNFKGAVGGRPSKAVMLNA
jgi:hypothetical protein